MEWLDLRERPDEGLLARVVDELYLPFFPDARQREDPARWRERLWGAGRATEGRATGRRDACAASGVTAEHGGAAGASALHVLVAGTELASERPELAGFIHYEYYRTSACGLLCYLAVRPEARRAGVARLLVGHAIGALGKDARDAGTRLAAIFGEVADPGQATGTPEAMDPAERLRIFARMGARSVPLAYVQPELWPGAGRLPMLLVAFPVGDGVALGSIAATTVAAFLEDYFASIGASDPGRDPELARMLAFLSAAPGGRVELAPLPLR